MNREMQIEFYGALAHRLTAKQKEKRISTSQIAIRAGVQFNTVRSVLEGKHFNLHQVVWITEMLDVSIDELLHLTMRDLRTSALKGFKNDVENKEESSEEESSEEKGIESFF